jgi:hypothetical protein
LVPRERVQEKVEGERELGTCGRAAIGIGIGNKVRVAETGTRKII